MNRRKVHIGREAMFVLVAVVGCQTSDQRLVELAERANDRQAEQNHQIALQNAEFAEATNRLVQADAESRRELVALERDLQAERTVIGQQRDELEDERRQIADDRYWDSMTGEAIDGGSNVLAVLVPLIVCCVILRAILPRDNDEAIGEILVADLTSDSPQLAPPVGGREQERLPPQ